MSHHEPVIFKTAFNCPSCTAYANQTWHQARAFHIHSPDEFKLRIEKSKHEFLSSEHENVLRKDSEAPSIILGLSANPYTKIVVDIYFACCTCCGKISIWYNNQILHPEKTLPIPPHEDMPSEVLSEYLEAASILERSPRAAMALLRLATETLCKKLGEEKNSLNENIGLLVKRGLSEAVQQALDVLRVTGNNAVHPGSMDLEDQRENALTLFKLLNFIVEKFVAEPKQLSEAFSSLPQGVRDAIDKRDTRNRP